MAARNGNGTLIAGVLAAIGASVCCVAPLVLLAFGIGGAWISMLTTLEPFRAVFIILMLLFLGLSFQKLYLMPKNCAVGTLCDDPRIAKRQRRVFWIVTASLLVLVAVPWIAPVFY
jgi:mercuric ion transport protein